MFTKDDLIELEDLERKIRFKSFSYLDAYKLGTMLHEVGLKTIKPIAIRIVIDDLIVFQSFIDGTNFTNLNWMNKKQRTVEKTHHCSLYALVNKEVNGIKEEWQNDDVNYAFCGGGFPLFINDEFHGAIIISGLPHLIDHKTLLDTLTEFLKTK